MMHRCNDPNVPSYKWYGARGIRVCDRWYTVASFIEDMGPRPEGYTLDRIDNDGDYEPGNCQWANPAAQNANQNRDYELCENGHPAFMKNSAGHCRICIITARRQRNGHELPYYDEWIKTETGYAKSPADLAV
jgi:hypothetical protein